MRRVFLSFVLIILLSVLSGGFKNVHASDFGTANPSAQYQELNNVFTLGELGYAERIMIGPYDTTRILFSTPATWQLQEGGKILLRYNYSSSKGNQAVLGGTLFVYFNNVILATIYLDQNGQVTKEIPIPVSALQAVAEDGRHFIGFLFDASINCEDDDFSSSLIISAESEVVFSYAAIAPEVDLSKFPRPFYQSSPLVRTVTSIIVPDQPTSLELQSALAVVAGLGALTFGELDIDLVPIGHLSDEARLSNNLIFVGLPASFPILQSVNMPAPVSGAALSLPGVVEDDGVVQLTLSPWNAAGVLMFVSGTTERGLIKAASILGSDRIFISGRPDIVVVSDVNRIKSVESVSDLRTFSDLGYGNNTFGDEGGQYSSYSFYVTAEQASTTGAYIDLVTSRSGMLDFEQTGISLILNGEVISTLTFDAATSQISTTRIEMLPDVLRRGNNLLEVVADIKPKNSCLSRDLQSNWITLSSSSSVYTPSSGRTLALNRNVNLDNFPYMFLTTDNLSDIAFVAPKNDRFSWREAANIAYSLGNSSNIIISDLLFAYGDEVSEEILNERSLIIVGRATTLPIISELGKDLPAPFEPGGDEAIQPAMTVNYRLLPGVSVGYLQLLSSPWNPDRSILAVLGNTEAGIPMASSSLTRSDLAFQLQGNFAVIYNDQIVTVDTRLGLSKESIVGELPIAVTATPSSDGESTPVSPVSPPNVQARAGWLLPSLIVVTLLVIGLAIIVVRNQIRDRKLENERSTSEKEE